MANHKNPKKKPTKKPSKGSLVQTIRFPVRTNLISLIQVTRGGGDGSHDERKLIGVLTPSQTDSYLNLLRVFNRFPAGGHFELPDAPPQSKRTKPKNLPHFEELVSEYERMFKNVKRVRKELKALKRTD